ncbi:MAG: hypothetical protein PHC28_07905 [Flavobacterium sp.]|uniref:hypothetical protein n=1 Tax=Flavobacterium sp. TaxID=239 RepID=UPI00261D0003|nr:hypothetical protein [Flavobacterium sp.]MDD5150396.1 hypothetical protein [Flavobacterium sp.]
MIEYSKEDGYLVNNSDSLYYDILNRKQQINRIKELEEKQIQLEELIKKLLEKGI